MPLKATANHQFLVYPNGRTGARHGAKQCKLFDTSGNLIKVCSSVKEASDYYGEEYGGSSSAMNRNKHHNGYYIEIDKNKSIENHKVQWLTAEEIEKTDYLLSPILSYNNDVQQEIYFSYEEQNPYKKSVVYINETIKVNNELAELLGFYLAEGNINHDCHGITFTIHQKEEIFKNKIIYLLERVFGINSSNISCYNKKDDLGLSIQVNSTPLGRWFKKYCDGNAYNKRVPDFIKNSSKQVQLCLFKGYFMGDGYGRKRTNGTFEAKITTASYQLAEDFWQLMANNYYNCSCLTEHRKDPRGINTNIHYNLMIYGKNAELLSLYKYDNIDFVEFEDKKEYIVYNGVNYYPVRINKIDLEQYCGKVYCLETENHNYLINNIVSHNCRGLGINPETGAYLASFIKADRGTPRTLSQTYYGDIEEGIEPDKKFRALMDGEYSELWRVAQYIEGLCCGVGRHNCSL